MQTQEQFVASGGMQSKSLIPMKILIVNQTIIAVVGFWYTLAWRMGRMTGGVLSNTFCSSSIVPVHTKLIRQCLTDNHPRPWASQHPPPPPSPSPHHPFQQTAPTYHGSRCTLCCIHYCQTGRGYNYLLYQLELFLNRGLYI